MKRLATLRPVAGSRRVERFGLTVGEVYELGEPDELGLVEVRSRVTDELLVRAPVEAFDPALRVVR